MRLGVALGFLAFNVPLEIWGWAEMQKYLIPRVD